MKLLDAGACGIVCPMVQNAEKVQRFVHYCLYPPQGIRSYGPFRPILYNDRYLDSANQTVSTIAMIETCGALNQLKSIVQVKQLKGLYIGPSDLALALNEPVKGDQHGPQVVDAIEKILTACKAYQLIAGIHCLSTEGAQRMIEKKL